MHVRLNGNSKLAIVVICELLCWLHDRLVYPTSWFYDDMTAGIGSSLLPVGHAHNISPGRRYPGATLIKCPNNFSLLLGGGASKIELLTEFLKLSPDTFVSFWI